jgi:hypothetical protein
VEVVLLEQVEVMVLLVEVEPEDIELFALCLFQQVQLTQLQLEVVELVVLLLEEKELMVVYQK